jgi:hypothetical protein
MAVVVGYVSAAGSVAADGEGLDAAAVLGLVVLLAYVGLLGWLHVRRRRRRRTEPAAVPATSEAAHAKSGGAASPRADDATAGSPSGAAPARPPRAAVPYAPPDLHPAAGLEEGPRRLSAATLEPLGACLESSRRVAAAEARVALVLGRLAPERWLVERYVVVAGQRVPFVVLGATGVFALWALDQTPRWDDLPFAARAQAGLQALLPGYAGPVRVGLCRAFADVPPRWWLSVESGCDAWLLGADWLESWLEHFGERDGLGAGDLACAARLSVPRWSAHPGTLPTPNHG